MIRLQNSLLRFHKPTKGNFSGEDFLIDPTVSFLDDSDSLAQIMPYTLHELPLRGWNKLGMGFSGGMRCGANWDGWVYLVTA